MSFTYPTDALDAFTTLTAGCLRNGDPADVVRTERASSIPTKYFYSSPRYDASFEGNAANFVHPLPITFLVDVCIRCAFNTTVEAEVESARAANVAAAGVTVFAEGAARTAARANKGSRLEAIALGACRAAVVYSFRINETDLNRNEREVCPLVFTSVPAADQASFAAMGQTANKGWQVSAMVGLNKAVNETLTRFGAMTSDEADLACGMFVIGQVSPVRAGAQIFTDGHHYLSDTLSSTRHRAIEKEVLAKLGTGARAIWTASTAMIRNAVWHAAIHPINSNLLEVFAEDPAMPARLDRTGYGSMSVGLPAQEALYKRFGSYVAVLNQVNQTAIAHAHTVSLDDIISVATALENVGRPGTIFPALKPAWNGSPESAWPTGVTSRAKVLKMYLSPALDSAEPVAAWMFGFYREICNTAGIRQASPEGSLLRSYSLKRAVSNYLGESNRASEMFRARARYLRTRAQDGDLEKYVGSA